VLRPRMRSWYYTHVVSATAHGKRIYLITMVEDRSESAIGKCRSTLIDPTRRYML
jgi:hypothetical protein